MKQTLIITKRELATYFTTPIGYVFMIAFLLLQWCLIFEMFQFFDQNQANMRIFFELLPYVYLIFIPAVSMRLWSEERRTGTIELLLTLPITTTQAVLGKFIAAWVFMTISLLMSISLVFTLVYLGSPDLGVIFSNYVGAILIGGAFLAIGSLTSALSKNQIISMLIAVFISLGFMFIDRSLNFLLNFKLFNFITEKDSFLIEFINQLGFTRHLMNIQKGIIDTRDIIYFISFIAVVLYVNVLLINRNKAK